MKGNMKTPLQNMFETQLKAFTGFDFQNVVSKIFLLKYGETDFTVIRPQKDKGCDGIIESEKRVIACFGPQVTHSVSKKQNDFKKKANEDFEKYKTHWQAVYPNWSVIINHQIDPQYDTIIKTITPNGTIIGLDQLLFMIDNLAIYQKRLLGKELRIDMDFFSSDYLESFLEDILRESENNAEEIKYDKKRVPVVEKFELNYDITDLQDAINEYDFLMEEGCLKLVDNLMSAYGDEEIKSMKFKILRDYNDTAGNFKARLNSLSNRYLEKYSSPEDDTYSLYIRAVLITLFEQCLIGEKK